MSEVARTKNVALAVDFGALCLFSAAADLAQDRGPVGITVAIFAVITGLVICGLFFTSVLDWDDGHMECTVLFFKHQRVDLDQTIGDQRLGRATNWRHLQHHRSNRRIPEHP